MLSLTLPVTRSEMKREIPTGVFRIPQLFKKKKKANLTTSGYSLVTFSILRVYSVSLVQSKHMQTISSCLWSLHTGAAHTLQANLVFAITVTRALFAAPGLQQPAELNRVSCRIRALDDIVSHHLHCTCRRLVQPCGMRNPEFNVCLRKLQTQFLYEDRSIWSTSFLPVWIYILLLCS